MKSVIYESLGLNVQLNVPASAEEYNLLFPRKDAAGNPIDACCEDAVDSTVFRSVLNNFRSRFCGLLELETGEKRKVKLTDKGEFDSFDESEKKFCDRVFALNDCSEDPSAKFQLLADKAVAGWSADATAPKDSIFASEAKPIIFDASASVRGPGKAKTIPKAIVAAVEQIIKAGKADALAAKLSAKIGKPVANDAESLGRAMHQYELDEARKKQAALNAQRQADIAELTANV